MDTEAFIDGPRERLRSVGAFHLSDAELVALLLGTGTAREHVTVLASRLLTEASGLRGLVRLGIGGLAATAGIGESKAARLVAALELGRRAAAPTSSPMSRVATSHDVVALVAPRLRDADVEHFVALALDAKNRPLALIDVAKGSITACPVAPADVFRAVLREAAPAVVFAHNHPSGDPQPSPEDIALTDRLVSAGRLLGIHVVDHVIIAREGHFSFLDAGLLARRPPRGVSA